MKVDFGAAIKTLSGVTVVEEVEKDGEIVKEPVTLKVVALNALMAQYKDEEKLTGAEKMSRYVLAQRIHGGNTEMSAEDVALLKKLIGKAYGTAVVGAAYSILEA